MALVVVELKPMLNTAVPALLEKRVMDQTIMDIVLVLVIVVLVIAAQIKMPLVSIPLVLMYLKHVDYMVIQKQLIFYVFTQIKQTVKI